MIGGNVGVVIALLIIVDSWGKILDIIKEGYIIVGIVATITIIFGRVFLCCYCITKTFRQPGRILIAGFGPLSRICFRCITVAIAILLLYLVFVVVIIDRDIIHFSPVALYICIVADI